MFGGAGGAGISPDDRRVQDQPLQVGVLSDLEDALPDPLAGPAVEPPPGGVPVAEALGQVPPRSTGPGDPEDGVDEEAVGLGNFAVLARSWSEMAWRCRMVGPPWDRLRTPITDRRAKAVKFSVW
jgi:hypothetical protein